MTERTHSKRSIIVLATVSALGAMNILPGCLSADDGHPLSGGASACVMWRQTSNCISTGPREPYNDKTCATVVGPGASGYCECAGRTVGFDCGHADITCSAVCGGGSGPAPDGGSGGSGPVADGGGGGSFGAFIRRIFAARTEILDPCALADDGDVCSDVLGPPAEPGALYSCRGQATQAITSCRSGCVVASDGDHCR